MDNVNNADNSGEEGLFLPLEECKILYYGLKKNEVLLSTEERMILYRMEKVIYRNLSIQEMESLPESTESKRGK